jgi:hypothetical protein
MEAGWEMGGRWLGNGWEMVDVEGWNM